MMEMEEVERMKVNSTRSVPEMLAISGDGPIVRKTVWHNL